MSREIVRRDRMPYRGEPERYARLFGRIIDVGATLSVNEAGRVVWRAPAPLPPDVRAELAYFRDVLQRAFGPHTLRYSYGDEDAADGSAKVDKSSLFRKNRSGENGR